MKVQMHDDNSMLANLIWSDDDLTTLVMNTPEWSEEGTVTALCYFNGVPCDARILEKALHHWLDIAETHFKEKYNADHLDLYIEERAKEILQEHADDILTTLGDLQRKLEESNTIITPHWER